MQMKEKEIFEIEIENEVRGIVTEIGTGETAIVILIEIGIEIEIGRRETEIVRIGRKETGKGREIGV